MSVEEVQDALVAASTLTQGCPMPILKTLVHNNENLLNMILTAQDWADRDKLLLNSGSSNNLARGAKLLANAALLQSTDECFWWTIQWLGTLLRTVNDVGFEKDIRGSVFTWKWLRRLVGAGANQNWSQARAFALDIGGDLGAELAIVLAQNLDVNEDIMAYWLSLHCPEVGSTPAGVSLIGRQKVNPSVRMRMSHLGNTTCVALLGTKRLALGLSSGDIVIRNLETGSLEITLTQANGVSGQLSAITTGGDDDAATVVFGAFDSGSWCQWTIDGSGNERGSVEVVLGAHTSTIPSIICLKKEWSSVATCSLDGTVKVWRRSGETQARWDVVHSLTPEEDRSNNREVHSLLELPDGSLATDGIDGIVRVWSLDSSSPMLVTQLYGPTDAVMNLGLCSGRIMAASADGSLYECVSEDDQEVSLEIPTGVDDGAPAFAVLGGESRLVFGDGRKGDLHVWIRSEGVVKVMQGGHWQQVTQAIVLSEQFLLTLGKDRAVVLWDLEADEGVECDLACVTVLQDGTVVSGGNSLLTWTYATGEWEVEESLPWLDLDGAVKGLAVAGTRFVTWSNSGSMSLWSSCPDWRVEDLPSPFSDDEIRQVVSLPSDRFIGLSESGDIHIWALVEGEWELEGNVVSNVCHLAAWDGTRVVIGDDQGTIALWNVDTCVCEASCDQVNAHGVSGLVVHEDLVYVEVENGMVFTWAPSSSSNVSSVPLPTCRAGERRSLCGITDHSHHLVCWISDSIARSHCLEVWSLSGQLVLRFAMDTQPIVSVTVASGNRVLVGKRSSVQLYQLTI